MQETRFHSPHRRRRSCRLWIAAVGLALAPPVAAQVVTTQRPRIQLPVTVERVTLTNFDEVACASAPNCDSNSSGIGVSAGAEYFVARSIYAGVRGGIWGADVTQSYGSGQTNHTDMTVYELAVLLGARARLGAGWWIFGNTGPSYLWNKGDIRTDFDGQSVTGSRSESGVRWSFGGGLDWDVSRKIGLRFSSSYLWGDGTDADESFRLGAGVVWKAY